MRGEGKDRTKEALAGITSHRIDFDLSPLTLAISLLVISASLFLTSLLPLLCLFAGSDSIAGIETKTKLSKFEWDFVCIAHLVVAVVIACAAEVRHY